MRSVLGQVRRATHRSMYWSAALVSGGSRTMGSGPGNSIRHLTAAATWPFRPPSFALRHPLSASGSALHTTWQPHSRSSQAVLCPWLGTVQPAVVRPARAGRGAINCLWRGSSYHKPQNPAQMQADPSLYPACNWATGTAANARPPAP